MKEFTITKSESGQTCIKYLQRLLLNAPGGLIYKQLRNKNIVLNGKKINGNEKLKEGDCVTIFFSDDTFEKFSKSESTNTSEYLNAYKKYGKPNIIYEDEHIIFINKPINMLSQKSNPSDISANEIIIGYLLKENIISDESLSRFTPSVCNRLDRNTGGLLSFGKTLYGTNILNNIFRNRTGHKYYRAIVFGKINEKTEIEGFLTKNTTTNKVSISKESGDYIKTVYSPVSYNAERNLSEIEIELITGKPHQIRAHLSSCGHPIIGDYKYGDININNKYKKETGLSSQLLYSVRFEFPENNEYPEISKKTLEIDVSEIFNPYLN